MRFAIHSKFNSKLNELNIHGGVGVSVYVSVFACARYLTHVHCFVAPHLLFVVRFYRSISSNGKIEIEEKEVQVFLYAFDTFYPFRFIVW